MNFKKFLIIYIGFLILLSAIFLLYVNSCLVKYENSQINNYVGTIEKDLKSAAKKNKITKHINTKNYTVGKYEKSGVNYESGLNDIIKNSTLSHKLNLESTDKSQPIYDIYAGDKKISTIHLKLKKYVTKLGLLTYPEWEILEIKPNLENGLYNYNITAPANYKVKINGNSLTSDDIYKEVNGTGLEDFNKYSSISSTVTYKVNKLAMKPEIKIYNDNNNEVSFTENGENIIAQANYYTTNDLNDAMSKIKSEFDILSFAKKWSLFLTDDLNGATHGFETLKPYLIKDSYMWKMAYSWATSVDITFTSSHTLKDPAFTNEKISNFVIYNDKAFSCDVYLEKNMNVARIGSQTDKMNEKMYFVYLNGSWRLVNMQAITGNK
ncbi:MAG TPA: hypothetical protein PK993_00880 [Clostridia bacterium]|nr:hypothetical protein [Clostridia bacterium]